MKKMGLKIALIPALLALLPSIPGTPSSAQKSESYIRFSQVGYPPSGVKSAIAFSTEPLQGSFHLIEAATGQDVFEGKLVDSKAQVWGKFSHHAELDFSAYRKPGRYFLKLAQSGMESAQFSIDTSAHYQFYPFMNLGHFALYDQVDQAFQKILAGYYRSGIESCRQQGLQSPYQIGIPFIWCSNNLVVALATQGYLFEAMTGNRSYRTFISAQLDWLFGRNPWGTSMFTGIPDAGVSPRDPHLVTTNLTGRTIRGGLVDGPVAETIFKSLKGVALSRPDPFADFQCEQAVYHDDMADYSSNEPTMDGTPPQFCCGRLLPLDASSPVLFRAGSQLPAQQLVDAHKLISLRRQSIEQLTQPVVHLVLAPRACTNVQQQKESVQAIGIRYLLSTPRSSDFIAKPIYNQSTQHNGPWQA
jgi:hypothetical protein